MSLDANKQTATTFLKAFALHDADTCSSLMTEDATYWVLGKPHLFAYSGEKTKEEICAYLATPSIFTRGVEVFFGAYTAEDNRVSVEAEIRGVMPDGRIYTNLYHYLITFRGGKISRVKEYLDTQSAAEFFSPPAN